MFKKSMVLVMVLLGSLACFVVSFCLHFCDWVETNRMMSTCKADFPKRPWSGSFTVVCFEDLPLCDPTANCMFYITSCLILST